MDVYIGTYTTRYASKGEGMYAATFDPESGSLSNVRVAASAVDPSFLSIHPTLPLLYAVGQVNVDGKHRGGINAYAIEAKGLRLVNGQPTGDRGPCHLIVDGGGNYVLCTVYEAGIVYSLPIERDGSLGEHTSAVQHEGSSVNAARQDSAHPHSINLDSENRFAFVCDLGLDRTMIYRFDAATGTLAPNDPSNAPAVPGAGPRHFAFHPSGRFAYVINELDETVSVFSYDIEKGALEERQTISTLPEDFNEESWCADIHVASTGKYVYGSNRGHDSIVQYEVDPIDGTLVLVGWESTRGQWPRNFAIDPTGNYILVANQKTNSIVSFRIEPESGALQANDDVISVPCPVCIAFSPTT